VPVRPGELRQRRQARAQLLDLPSEPADQVLLAGERGDQTGALGCCHVGGRGRLRCGGLAGRRAGAPLVRCHPYCAPSGSGAAEVQCRRLRVVRVRVPPEQAILLGVVLAGGPEVGVL